MVVFDYIFYVIASMFKEFDGKQGITGQIAVLITQSMLILNPLGIYYMETYDVNQREELGEKIDLFIIILMLVLFIIINRRYRKKFDQLYERWKGEGDLAKAFKSTLVVLFILGMIFFLPILISVKDYTQ